MRKFLPSEAYRLLKNRKSARLCRRKRKEERSAMQCNVEKYTTEIALLKAKVSDLENALKQSENIRIQIESTFALAY